MVENIYKELEEFDRHLEVSRDEFFLGILYFLIIFLMIASVLYLIPMILKLSGLL